MKIESGIFFMRLDLMQLELSAERKKREKLMEKSGRWLSLPQRRPCCSVSTIKWSIRKCDGEGSLQKNCLHVDQVDCNLAHPSHLFTSNILAKVNFQFLTASTDNCYWINVIMMMKIVTMMMMTMMMMMMITHWSPQVQYSRLNEPWKDWKGGSWRPRCCSMQTVDLCPYIMHCHTRYLSFPGIFQSCFICNAVSSQMRTENSLIYFI